MTDVSGSGWRPGESQISFEDRRARVRIDASAVDTETWARSIFRAEGPCVVEAVYWIPDAAVTGDDTDYFGLGVRNEGTDGTGTDAVTVVKDYDTGTDSVANVPEALTLGAAADLVLAAGEVLSLVRSSGGSGLASPSGVIEVHYR